MTFFFINIVIYYTLNIQRCEIFANNFCFEILICFYSRQLYRTLKIIIKNKHG